MCMQGLTGCGIHSAGLHIGTVKGFTIKRRQTGTLIFAKGNSLLANIHDNNY